MNKTKNMTVILVFFLIIAPALCNITFLPAQNKEPESEYAPGDQKQSGVSDSQKEGMSSEPKPDSEMKRPENISPELWERYLRTRKMVEEDIVPIEFYGKITDQNGIPVPGVKISITVSFSLKNKTEKIELSSDNGGLFSLTGIRGSRLYIDKFEKEGYIEGNFSRRFGYGRHTPEIHYPNRDNPVVIRMWKKGETEPLVREETEIIVTGDNREFYTDLISGTTSEELTDQADLVIRMKIDKPDEENLYNWHISIGAVNGGLIETDDEFLYQAPESGYQQNMNMFFDKTFRWSNDAYKKLYLKSRNGKVYAGLKLRILTYHTGKGLIRISSLINPNGSRNLEYDPAKRIRVKRH